jgi:hypothetical protein
LPENNHLHPFQLLHCEPNVCQECGVDHKPELPHNQQSLYYQYRFYGQHGRWPTWDDAMAHCTEDMRQKWSTALAEVLARKKNA